MLNKFQKSCKMLYRCWCKADVKQQDMTEPVAASYNIL